MVCRKGDDVQKSAAVSSIFQTPNSVSGVTSSQDSNGILSHFWMDRHFYFADAATFDAKNLKGELLIIYFLVYDREIAFEL